MHLLVAARPESLVCCLHIVVLTVARHAVVLHVHLLLLIVRLILDVVIVVGVVLHLRLLLDEVVAVRARVVLSVRELVPLRELIVLVCLHVELAVVVLLLPSLLLCHCWRVAVSVGIRMSA